MTLADCFFGIGGNDIAFKNVFPDGKIPWGSELNKNKYGRYLDDLSKKNIPEKKNLGDITCIKNAEQTKQIVGGFPCQDISGVNPNFLLKKGLYGTSGSKSSLYIEQLRIALESNIPIICFENVSDICKKGLNNVLHDLYEMGYDIQYITYYLYEFGLPHRRGRTFIVAYKNFKTNESIFNPDLKNFMKEYKFEIPKIKFDENNLTFTHNDIEYPLLVERKNNSYRYQGLGNSVHVWSATYQQDAVYRIENHKTTPIVKKYLGHINNFYDNKRTYRKLPNCGLIIDGQFYETPSLNKKSFTPSKNFPFSIPTPLKTISSQWDDCFCLTRYDSKERYHIGKTSEFNIDPTTFFRKWYLLKNIKNIKTMDINDFNKIKKDLPDLIVNPILMEILMGFPIDWTKL